MAIDLNKELNDHSIVEYERCTLVSAILLALQDESFRESYESQARTQDQKPKPERLAKCIVEAIKQVFEDREIDKERVATMISEYQTIKNKPLAKESKIKKKKAYRHHDNFVIRDITKKLEQKILPLMQSEKGYDVLGRFYTEFIRYAGADKKTGLVLTPRHITEFLCDIVELGKNDVVFDSCCGTGGFLVSAMKKMLLDAGNDEEEKKKIRQEQIIGIEKRTDMFTFACSNMMMSGDGKAHIYQGDSFADEWRKKVARLRPTVAFLNPPYDVDEDGQLNFIDNALSYLVKGGRCAAIVQMSCATSNNAEAKIVKSRILEKHTLKSVFSMPNELFHPVGVVTCVMVFEAGTPHRKNFKPYFGYLKDDGFIKKRNLGRIDKGGWSEIKKDWLNKAANREVVPGRSVTMSVDANSEWCAEAYIETSYEHLNEESFVVSVKDLVSHYFKIGILTEIKQDPQKTTKRSTSLAIDQWPWFSLVDFFRFKGASSHTKSEIAEFGTGRHPYVVCSSENNGVQGLYDHFTEEGNVLTVDSATVGSCFYQAFNFAASEHVEKLIPEFEMNVFNALFIKTIMDLEKFRYGYGRKFAQIRLKETKIRLPEDVNGKPDWKFMENYIKSLSYSSNLTPNRDVK